MRKRRARRRAVGTRAPILVEARPNARWSLDFVHDQFACGRRFRVLNIVDDVTSCGRRKDCLHRTRKPLGERLLRELQFQAPGRVAQRGNLLLPGRGPGRDRGLAPALQHRLPTQLPRLQAASAGDLHPRAPGSATRTSYAGRATVGPKAHHELTLTPDHPSGADHRRPKKPISLRDPTFRRNSHWGQGSDTP